MADLAHRLIELGTNGCFFRRWKLYLLSFIGVQRKNGKEIFTKCKFNATKHLVLSRLFGGIYLPVDKLVILNMCQARILANTMVIWFYFPAHSCCYARNYLLIVK